MSTQDILDRMRDSVPGCRISAFGDLETALVLRVSSHAPIPREHLDDLALSAQRVFELARSVGLNHSTSAITFSAQTTDVFARTDADGEEFAAARFEPAVPLRPASVAVEGGVQNLVGDG